MQIRTTGLAATAAERLSAATAPCRTSGSALAGERFHTVTSWPAARKHRASADPMRPSPKAETSVMGEPPGDRDGAAGTSDWTMEPSARASKDAMVALVNAAEAAAPHVRQAWTRVDPPA